MKIKATMCLLAAGVTITTMGACVKSPYASAAEEAAVEQIMVSAPATEDSDSAGYPHTWETCEGKARGFDDPHLNYWLDRGSVYDPDEITEEMLLSRDDSNVIIEHIHGICMDEEGNGRVLNTDSEYDYIAYNGFSCTASVEIGDIVDTYLIYDPACQAPDCIIERRDFIVYHSEDAAIETAELEALYGKNEEN